LPVEQTASDCQQHQSGIGGNFRKGALSTQSTLSTTSTPMHLPHPLCHLISSGTPAINQFLPPEIVPIPDRQSALVEGFFSALIFLELFEIYIPDLFRRPC
jgi:hypothetical protein